MSTRPTIASVSPRLLWTNSSETSRFSHLCLFVCPFVPYLYQESLLWSHRAFLRCCHAVLLQCFKELSFFKVFLFNWNKEPLSFSHSLLLCFLWLLVGGSPSRPYRGGHLSESPCFLSVHVQAGTLFVSLGPKKGWWHPVWALSELMRLCLLASWVQWFVHRGLQPVGPSVSSYPVYKVFCPQPCRETRQQQSCEFWIIFKRNTSWW